MSKTLVIHPDDRSTDFLKEIYKDKDYDVVRNANFPRRVLREYIKDHDRIIMMGHGTPNGLINPSFYSDGYNFYTPYVIDASFVDLLREKETISIWCNSDAFYRRYGLADGQLHTGIIISEVSEQEYILGHAYLNGEEQMANMYRFAEAVHGCIDLHDGEAMREYILEHYTGGDEVTKYNRDRLIVI